MAPDPLHGTTRREAIARGAGAAAALTLGGGLTTAVARAATTPRRGTFRLGLTSLEQEIRVPRLDVDGRLPPWLNGVLIRNGPALFEVGEQQFNHWFDGLAMLHAFAFGRGRVSYANRFLRSSAYEAYKREGKIKYSEFATDPCRSVFAGVSSIPVLGQIPNANVSVEALADRFVAHTEIPVPVRFDPRTLRTLGVEDDMPLGTLGTAHPHHDRVTGERFSYEVNLVGSPGYRVLAHKGARRRELAFIPRAEPGYMHSFALTRRYVVLFEQPFVVDPASFLSPTRKPIIENYRWEASQPSRIIVVDRRAGGVRATVEVDPFFVFHHINATERGDRITLDVCAHKDSTIIDALYLKRLRKADQRIPRVRVRRIDVDPARSTASVRDLSDVDLELPRIHYARVSQHDHRHVYGIGMRTPASAFTDQLVKLDAHTGAHRTWHDRGCYPGEPVFVPAGGRDRVRNEDDGVVLSVVLDAGRGTSFLLVLDAPTMSERARAAVPHHIPFGFHGMHVAA